VTVVEDRLLTAEDVAEITGMRVDWIYRQTREGKLKAVRMGRYYRYRRSTVEHWIESLEGPEH
jgi:excisionase family DNA binding protein